LMVAGCGVGGLGRGCMLGGKPPGTLCDLFFSTARERAAER